MTAQRRYRRSYVVWRTIYDRRAEVQARAPTPSQKRLLWSKTPLACLRDKKTYEPYPPFAAAHDSPASVVFVSGANRVGKSLASAMEAIAWTPFSRLIWFVGPSYFHTRKEFEYYAEGMMAAKLLKEEKLSMAVREHMACSAVATVGMNNGLCVIQTKTLRDMIKSLQSDSPDIIILCEAGLIPEDPVDRLRIRLSTSRGRLWISGTIEEAAEWLRAAYDRWEDGPDNDELAQSFNIPLWFNISDFPGGEANPEIEYMRKNLNRNLFIEKIEGKPAPSEYLVFGWSFYRGNVPFFAHDCVFQQLTPEGQRWPVEICIDPGYHPSHYSVVALQRHGEELWAIGEVAVQGQPHEAVIKLCQAQPWWENVIGGVMDPWPARSHGVGYQATPLDIWVRETGLPIRAKLAPKPEEIVERWKFFLVHPSTGECRFFFDPRKCPRLAYELAHWRYQKDAMGRPIKTEPQRRNCDSIKAIGCFLVDEYSTQSWQRHFGPAQVAKTTAWHLS